MKLVITGSLGHVAGPLAKQLAEKGHDVTVISSNEARKKDIESIGAKALIGSVDDAKFLTDAFKGADAVFLMVPPEMSPNSRAFYSKAANAYSEALKASGVKRAVYMSSIGAHLDKGTGLILGSHDSEEILNKLQDVNITYLRPAYFYYNLNNFAGMIKNAGFIATNYGGDDKLLMVSPRDIADVAAEELLQPGRGHQVRYVASDERTAQEVAAILGKAIGKSDLKWKLISDEEMQKGTEQAGVPAQVAAQFVEMGNSIHTGIIREDFDRHKPAFGNRKIEEFAKEFAEIYKSVN